ncbi:chemotaxis protein [Tamlana haliotis]|uniref:Chemotaxis protein n=1 Tax=Pseudotamlana haliotis TaxID=2614804 RepID=A0A6N6M8T7_9FLAO|nr:MCP four helix bundle domain-containing protein [Tamlana haliotis]KAB1066814.1 chemotaxis protein [Tamlana haliotis]
MTFYDKVKWTLGILMVFVLIMATNLIDKNNFERVRDSVVTIYEDRVIASDLIFEMLKSVQEKELAVAVSDSTFFSAENANVNDHLHTLVSRFEETKLTRDEAEVFQNLKENVQLLVTAENQFLKSNQQNKTALIKHIEALKTNLDDLSEIQLSEGSRQVSISRRALNAVELFTQIEIFILVFLAIVIQVIVMYKPKEKD